MGESNQFKRVRPDAFIETEHLKPVSVFMLKGRAYAAVQPERLEDDLGEFEGSYYVFSDVPMSVERHEGSPPNEFTLRVDVVAAQQLGVGLDWLVGAFLGGEKIGRNDVLWSASE